MNAIKTLRKVVVMSLAVLLLFSCSEDEITTFDGEDNVYFSLKKWTSSASGSLYSVSDFQIGDVYHSQSWTVYSTAWDSIFISLALDGTLEGYHVVLIPVTLSGNLADYDRPLAYSVGEKSTAIEGTHFKVDAFVPANKRRGAIGVSINREAMQDTVLFVDFRLQPNEYFHTNYAKINRSSTDTTKVDMAEFRLRMSSFIEKPPLWDSAMKNYLGDYSQKKMFLVLSLTRGDINELYVTTTSKLNVGLVIAWGKVLKNYLNEQKAAGNTIYEADGVTEMIAGKNV